MQKAFLKIKLNGAKALLSLGIIMLVSYPGLYAAGQPVTESEYRLKAAFLYNFAKYVTWPDRVKSSEKFIIGIIGENPFGRELDIIKGKMINDLKIEIRQYESIEDVRDCSVLFIASSERENIPVIVSELNKQAILTVGDTSGYAEMGIMINLYEAENRVRFEINNRAAESAGLKISSHLLRLGKIVEPENKDLQNEKIQ
jgi:hypothetical protein